MWNRATVFSVVLLLSVSVRGQATQPATGPVAGGTPKDALKTFAIALDAGDGPRIRSLMNVTSPMERKIVEATSELAVAIAEFKHAMNGRFGEPATLAAMGDSADVLKQSLAGIDSAEEKVDGDVAVVSLPRESMSLLRVSGEWRISVAQQVKEEGLTAEQVDEKMASVSGQAKMLKDMSAEVASGKYANAADAAAALRGKMSGGHDNAAPAPQ
jgi:hypothetical protein